jgi:hypothetical protein
VVQPNGGRPESLRGGSGWLLIGGGPNGASNVLEHVLDFSTMWRVVSRVLKPGGTVEVHVPWGVNYDPYRIWYFSRRSVHRLTLAEPGRSLDDRPGRYRVRRIRKLRNMVGFPCWHAWHRLNVRLPLCPWRPELWFTLEKKSPHHEPPC